MNNKARKYSIISGLVLSTGLLLLTIAALVADTTKIAAINSETGEHALVSMWQGFSFNYYKIGNLILFCTGIVFSILGITAFGFCNAWLTKRLSTHQIKETFGKKRSFIMVAIPLLIIGLIVSFIAGGSWDSYQNPDGERNGMATSIHQFLAIGMFGASFILILLQTSIIFSTKNIKGEINIIPRKEV